MTAGGRLYFVVGGLYSVTAGEVCVFITGEGESQNKGKQIWSYEERR